jgi:serine/threonine protein kinase
MTAVETGDLAQLLPGYEVGGELGRGGMGVVRAGMHRQLSRKVAIKELPPVLSTDPTVRTRFVAEARVLAGLDHPHIVPIYDFVERDGVCALVMEQLPGGTVWDHFTDEGVEPPAACSIVMVTCAGLHYAHQAGILHRDVKPENLMFSASGQLKVTDFGIARVIGGNEALATSAGEILGTPAYMAPEQAEGRDLGPQADVYAAGIMLYELLSGRLPFSEEGGALAIVYRHVHDEPTPLLDVAPHVPPAIAEVTMRALAKAPDDRYPSAEAFGVAIAEAAAASWGPGWMSQARITLMAPGPILSAAERPTLEHPGRGPSTGDVASAPGTDPRATGVVAPPPPPGPATETAAPPPGTDATPPAPSRSPSSPAAPRPASATVTVRPVVDEHVGGAEATKLAPEEILSVSEVLEPPSRPLIPALATLALAIVTIALAFAGIGEPDRTTTFGPGQATLAGVDVAAEEPALVDFEQPIAFEVTDPAAMPAGAVEARLGFSVAGIPLVSSSTETLTAGGAGQRAELDATGNRFLAAGLVEGELELLDADGTVIAAHQLAVERDGTSYLTLPGILVVVLSLVLLAYAESVLRPLRRQARRRITGTIALVVLGAGFGLLVHAHAWLLKATEVTAAGAVTCAVAGAVTGLLAALTAIQAGRRARVLRVLNSKELQRLFSR